MRQLFTIIAAVFFATANPVTAQESWTLQQCIDYALENNIQIKQQNLAVDSGAWVLFRYNPALAAQGKNPLTLDSKEPSVDIKDYMDRERRFKALRQMSPERADTFLAMARARAKETYSYYKYLADRPAQG